MNRLLLLIGAVTGVGLYLVIAPLVVETYRRYRGRKTIVCPETGEIVEVELKAGRAGLMSLFGTAPARVKHCSLWPRKKDCAEECVKEYWESASEDEPVRAEQRKLS